MPSVCGSEGCGPIRKRRERARLSAIAAERAETSLAGDLFPRQAERVERAPTFHDANIVEADLRF